MARRTPVEGPTETVDPFDQAFGSETPEVTVPEPARRSRLRGKGSSDSPKPAKAAKAPKAPKAPRKAARAAGAVTDENVAKKIQERKQQISTGTRYNGDRKKWLAFMVALILIPVVSVSAAVIALNRPSEQDVVTLVDQRLAAGGNDFPSGDAVSWTGQVVQSWATWDEKDESGLREATLSQYLSQGMDAAAGWNGKGTQAVQAISVNPSPKIQDDTRASIEAAYQTDAGVWRCLSLSVFAYKPESFSDAAPHAFSLAANPTPVACPPRTGAPALADVAKPGYGDNDNVNADTLMSQFMPGFFAAWAASDTATLGQYTSTDATLIGLGGAFESAPNPIINTVQLPLPITAEGTSRATDPEAVWLATVSVTWTLPGTTTQLTSSYDVELKKSGTQWQVTKEPEPIVQEPGLSGAPYAGNSTGAGETPGLGEKIGNS